MKRSLLPKLQLGFLAVVSESFGTLSAPLPLPWWALLLRQDASCHLLSWLQAADAIFWLMVEMLVLSSWVTSGDVAAVSVRNLGSGVWDSRHLFMGHIQAWSRSWHWQHESSTKAAADDAKWPGPLSASTFQSVYVAAQKAAQTQQWYHKHSVKIAVENPQMFFSPTSTDWEHCRSDLPPGFHSTHIPCLVMEK